jgi:uncharacterized membrane protein YGL010W
LKSLESWLDEYAKDHLNPQNKLIHKICVPLIFFTMAGALHVIPITYNGFSLGDGIVALVILSYVRWGVKPLALMFMQWLIAIAITVGIQTVAGEYTIWILLAVFAEAWIGQFIGHGIEGKRPSFLTDLQYLLIGPLWIWLGH